MRPAGAPPVVSGGAFWLLAASFAAAILLGHDGRRAGQVAVLALPALLWLRWPLADAGARRARALAVWLWGAGFAADGAFRAYLLDAYQAAPDSAMVVGAIANTSARESAEYLAMAWPPIALAAGGLLLLVATMGLALWPQLMRPGGGAPPPHRPQRGAVRLLLLVLLLAAATAYAVKPWRRLHPLLFWPGWVQTVQAQRLQWSDQSRERMAALERARTIAPTVSGSGASTVMLVVSESIVRDNLGLYGYARATTPRLEAARAQLGGSMVVLRNAWSVDASTLPALQSLFHLQTATPGTPLHLLALARAAGYRVWWIGNQDDVAIEQLHARHADELRLVNRVPGRASISPDGVVLAPVREALADPHPRKLIVVHLMGAHPHYDLRYPAGENPWASADDAVTQAMVAQGRPAWLRRLRGDYDAALRYQDGVVADLLGTVRDLPADGGTRAWMYLSDHGQEVGHVADHAGHSPSTPAGYRIPTLVWRSPAVPLPPGLDERPFRADWAAATIAGLLRLDGPELRSSKDVLADGYRWQAPRLPVPVDDFDD